MEEKIGFLRKLLRYELQSAERYRRFVSLVMVASSERAGRAKKVVKETLRDSDVMADFDGAAVILMSETTSAGALTAIERYKEREGQELRFSLVTYPSDGGGEENLMAVAYRRLQKAVASEAGSIVMSG